jgi:uncharacterized protein YndB with AHSA1/START domain
MSRCLTLANPSVKEQNMILQDEPIARAEMLIRKPAANVFEAFIDPAITSKFWFTRSSGRVEEGAELTWYWDMYGVSAKVVVKSIEKDRRI